MPGHALTRRRHVRQVHRRTEQARGVRGDEFADTTFGGVIVNFVSKNCLRLPQAPMHVAPGNTSTKPGTIGDSVLR